MTRTTIGDAAVTLTSELRGASAAFGGASLHRGSMEQDTSRGRFDEFDKHATPSSRVDIHRALSNRQAQVAALVARGKPNREIALALSLSPRTVDAHLAAIFNRLAINSRSELTAMLSLFELHHPLILTTEMSDSRAGRNADAGGSPGHALSVRQAEIAALASRGKSNREIALKLGRSPRTIDAHIVVIFRKLNVRSRGELAAALSFGQTQLTLPPTSQNPRPLPVRSLPIRRFDSLRLSARAKQVAALVAIGKSNREIGTDLDLSSRTVATHVIALVNKFNVVSRGELIAVLNSQDCSVVQGVGQRCVDAASQRHRYAPVCPTT